MAVRDIADQTLVATMSSLTLSSASTSNCGAFPSRSATVCCLCAAVVDEMSDKQRTVGISIDKTAGKNSEVAESKNTDTNGATSCSKSDMTSVSSSSLPSAADEGCKDSEAVSSVLCLLHGLSHCSYHKPSLLVLADYAAYDAAVDLFVCLWHRLQTCQQPDDKTQACLFHFMFSG